MVELLAAGSSRLISRDDSESLSTQQSMICDKMDCETGTVNDPLLMRTYSENALQQIMPPSYGSSPTNQLEAKVSHSRSGSSVCVTIPRQSLQHPDTNPARNHRNRRDDDFEIVMNAKEALFGKTETFDLVNCPERGFRATTYSFCKVSRPYMRAMHAAWICSFAAYTVQFAMAPLLPQLQISLHLSQKDIWLSNVWMAIGGIPMRCMLGPLCDTYGPRSVMCIMLVACAVPCALSGLIVFNLPSLLFVRFVIGSMDAFVPSQCWITTMFVREVTGTIMAIVAGLGASGSAFSQLVVGFLFERLQMWTGGNDDLAWKLTLVFPAAFAILIAYWAYEYTDDSPLGNFIDVKKAGVMLERSAVDSFRSGAFNLNAWIMSVQYGFSSGVDTSLCNGLAIYYHVQYYQKISTGGAISALYGCSALWARGLGGYISDKVGNRFSLKGRLWIHCCCMLAQGGANILFARSETLGLSLVVMVILSVLIQISAGTCYGIVPFIDSANTGSIAGIVGGGGNVGALVIGLIFMYHDYRKAFEIMGACTGASALLSPFIVIKGYKGMLFGQEDHDDPNRKHHCPLMVPKLHHSPHFVKLKRIPYR